MRFSRLPLFLLVAAAPAFRPFVANAASADADRPDQLPEVTVYSPRVANQAPAGTFAMPVSALRYEPRVDLQGRDLVESQADVTIRGGVFENTGFRVGALTVTDPQTGHYLAELPIAPQMLGAPAIITGAELASSTTNATVGAVTYDWRPVRTAGALQAGFGPHQLWRADAYQGYSTGSDTSALRLGADVDVAHSESNGPIAFGDHRFDRVNARVQLAGSTSQTDLFAGYQAKFFGWPNMYTPFNSDESENLETLLLSLNHRVNLGAGDYVSMGAYHRRNKDDYAFNRFAALSARHPFQHTTWEDGAAVEGRHAVGDGAAIFARAELLTDFLKSTSLTAGHYHSRLLTKVSVLPEKTWTFTDGDALAIRAGAAYDDSNRDRGTVSPVAEITRSFTSGAIRQIHASYAETTQEPSYTALNSSATGGLFRGNPNLRRETTRNLELGTTVAAAGWSVDATVFARRDLSLVDWTFTMADWTKTNGKIARTANAVDVDTLGFETVARRTWRAIDVVFGYTALTKDPNYHGATFDASFYALNYARQRLTAAITARLGHGFELRMDNVARVQAANVLRANTSNRAVHTTLALGWRPEFWHGVELTAQIDNLWNSDFQEVPAVPATPRLWSVGATYVW